MIMNFLNPEGHQNPIRGSKVTAILLKVWILPIPGVASGSVCACGLFSIDIKVPSMIFVCNGSFAIALL